MRQDVVCDRPDALLRCCGRRFGRQFPKWGRAFPTFLYGYTFGVMTANAYICTIKQNLNPTDMKKITSIMAMLLMAISTFTLTGCNEDEEISNTLWGVWRGDMGMCYPDGDYYYNASYTVLAFDKDPDYSSSGEGYWIDYYSNGRYSYYATNIRWCVKSGIITISSIEDDETWCIRDYDLKNGYFTGVIYSDYSEPMSFSLTKTSSPNWNDYYWDGWYSSGYYGYSNAKQQSRSAEATGSVPVRRIRSNSNE